MKAKVLIVDDQFGIRMLLHEVFQQEEIDTFQAANGVQAIECVQNEKPDLILLDMKIPGMDGLEILKRVKEIEPNVVVIMMTAYGELNLIEKAKKLGAIMHFSKPFDINEVRLTVKEKLKEMGVTSES
ncbi:MAG TPA: response regulator [Massilibacterium sp.]|nr:response regulator [Massilibacterium sp.]